MIKTELEQALETTSNELGLIFGPRYFKEDIMMAGQVDSIYNNSPEDLKEKYNEIMDRLSNGVPPTEEDEEFFSNLSENQMEMLMLHNVLFRRTIEKGTFELKYFTFLKEDVSYESPKEDIDQIIKNNDYREKICWRKYIGGELGEVIDIVGMDIQEGMMDFMYDPESPYSISKEQPVDVKLICKLIADFYNDIDDI